MRKLGEFWVSAECGGGRVFAQKDSLVSWREREREEDIAVDDAFAFVRSSWKIAAMRLGRSPNQQQQWQRRPKMEGLPTGLTGLTGLCWIEEGHRTLLPSFLASLRPFMPHHSKVRRTDGRVSRLPTQLDMRCFGRSMMRKEQVSE